MKDNERDAKKNFIVEGQAIPDRQLSAEEMKVVTDEINKDSCKIRIYVYWIWLTKSYVALGLYTFKDYVNQRLIMSYDAAIKQVMAAHYANELFGSEKIGYFSDSAMRTIGRLTIEGQIGVVTLIAKRNSKSVLNLTPKELTRASIEDAVKELGGVGYFKKWKNNVKFLVEDTSSDFSELDFTHEDHYRGLKSAKDIKDSYGRLVWEDGYEQKFDPLAELDQESLFDTLMNSYSLVNMLQHIKDHFPESMAELTASISANHSAVLHSLYRLYFPADCGLVEQNPELNDASSEFEEVYPDAESAEEIQVYREGYSELVDYVNGIVEEHYFTKYPKIALINAVVDALESKDLEYVKMLAEKKLDMHHLSQDDL